MEELKNYGKVSAEVVPKSNPREREDCMCWGTGVEKILVTEASQMSRYGNAEYEVTVRHVKGVREVNRRSWMSEFEAGVLIWGFF